MVENCCAVQYFCSKYLHDPIFYESLMNRKFERTALFEIKTLLYHYKCLYCDFNVFLLNKRTKIIVQSPNILTVLSIYCTYTYITA